MAKYGAIIRRFYDDEVKDYGKQQFEPVVNLYTLFLYETVTKGSMPKYSIKGSDKSSVLSVANRFIEKYNLKKVNNGNTAIVSDVEGYDPPIITNLETGEVFIDD